MSKKVILTGANGGFGKLTVKNLLNNGHSVAATMRNIEGKNAAVAKEFLNLGASVIDIDVTNDGSVEEGIDKACKSSDYNY
jgi:NAD(P)-dependent dehydrogenase (short-subunit alcohol dehydrogenase family)